VWTLERLRRGRGCLGCESPAQHHTRLAPGAFQGREEGIGAARKGKARPRHTIIDDDLTGAVCGLLSSTKWPPKSRAVSQLGPEINVSVPGIEQASKYI